MERKIDAYSQQLPPIEAEQWELMYKCRLCQRVFCNKIVQLFSTSEGPIFHWHVNSVGMADFVGAFVHHEPVTPSQG
jgi:hypothetical protein